MTPFRKLVRGVLERLIGQYYEGPEAPDRLGEMVVAFANQFPEATRREWVEFVKLHIQECYQSGFVRGSEWAERDFKTRMPSVRPEEIADFEDPGWRWRPGITLTGDTNARVAEKVDPEL